jgi:3',5'-cyclic AMP phosphodiesterase CpdA
MSYQFLVLSDTHFFAPGVALADKTWWNRVLQTRSEEIAANIVDTVREIKPDFIIHCGDITGHGDMANYEFGCQVMNATSSPWYAVPGNHDTWFPGVRAALSQRYGLLPQQCHYSLNLAGLRFIFLDVAYWHSIQGEVSPYLDKELFDTGQIYGMGPSPAELTWFGAELVAAEHEPVVVVSHAPLGFRPIYRTGTLPYGLPAPEGQISLVDRMGDIALRQSLRELIRRSGRVVLALAGHWHIHEVLREEGVIYCQTASLREYPFEMRQCVVYPDHISVSTIGLKDPELSRSSYISEWGNSWVAGNARDREFSVSLQKT